MFTRTPEKNTYAKVVGLAARDIAAGAAGQLLVAVNDVVNLARVVAGRGGRLLQRVHVATLLRLIGDRAAVACLDHVHIGAAIASHLQLLAIAGKLLKDFHDVRHVGWAWPKINDHH